MVTINGEECHNEWEITFEEIHRNGAIAFAIFNYIRYSYGDSIVDSEFPGNQGSHIKPGEVTKNRINQVYAKKLFNDRL